MQKEIIRAALYIVACPLAAVLTVVTADTMRHHQQAQAPTLSEIVLDTIGNAENIVTDSDCEHAEAVLTAYARELAAQGATPAEIRAALATLAAEY